jgi:TPR repeat protein
MEGTSGVLGMLFSDDNPLRDSIDQTISEALMNDDYVSAHRRARLLAESGNANAQVLLGALFQDGCGTDVDYGEAVKWYRNASEQGHPVAQVLLANRYRDGEGICKDLEQTRALYLKAAEQNYATAYYALAAMCYFGSSRPNLVETYKWAKLASTRLKTSGHKALMVQLIEGLEKDMASEEIAEAGHLINEWKAGGEEAAERKESARPR